MSIGSNKRYVVDYVELETLRTYLQTQYAGMGGVEISNHARFCDHAPGRREIVLVGADELGDYLSAQYAGMGGGDIANHRFFLRSCPKVTVEVTQ